MKISNANQYQKYYLDGFYEGYFNSNKHLYDLNNNLLSILEQNILPGYVLKMKYPGTKDLKPNPFKYHNCFLDILFSNNIPDLISTLTGKELTLSHLQVRTSNISQSYMPWHRDSFVKGDEYIGCCPPVHKLIFYPQIDKPRQQLVLAKGSHICNIRHQPADKFVQDGLSHVDREILKAFEDKYYYSSKNKFLFFNTGIMHCVVPEELNKKSIRIIYSFCEPEQFSRRFSDKQNHVELNKVYEDLKFKNLT